MTVDCVPCFIYLSFALLHGRPYAMKPQTDDRGLRYRAFVNGSEVPIEAMDGLRGRDWVDAFGAADHVPGRAPILAGGQWLDPLGATIAAFRGCRLYLRCDGSMYAARPPIMPTASSSPAQR
jgi:hypothetical protein